MTFTGYVNRHRHLTGLPHIPEGKVTPHMFRRTMAMLTSDFPGSEIAIGMQLKHMATRALANRHTQGYYAAAPAWATYFDATRQAARFQKLRDLYDAAGAARQSAMAPAPTGSPGPSTPSPKRPMTMSCGPPARPSMAMSGPNTTCSAKHTFPCGSASSTTARWTTPTLPGPTAWKTRSRPKDIAAR